MRKCHEKWDIEKSSDNKNCKARSSWLVTKNLGQHKREKKKFPGEHWLNKNFLSNISFDPNIPRAYYSNHMPNCRSQSANVDPTILVRRNGRYMFLTVAYLCIVCSFSYAWQDVWLIRSPKPQSHNVIDAVFHAILMKLMRSDNLKPQIL